VPVFLRQIVFVQASPSVQSAFVLQLPGSDGLAEGTTLNVPVGADENVRLGVDEVSVITAVGPDENVRLGAVDGACDLEGIMDKEGAIDDVSLHT